MWFAAYRSVAENAWFERLIHELLKGSPAVLALVAANPFPDRPPKYVRALLYDYYRFADPDSYARTEQWWVRRLEGLYFPQVTLADFPRAVRGRKRLMAAAFSEAVDRASSSGKLGWWRRIAHRRKSGTAELIAVFPTIFRLYARLGCA